jgi:hypothetical protein
MLEALRVSDYFLLDCKRICRTSYKEPGPNKSSNIYSKLQPLSADQFFIQRWNLAPKNMSITDLVLITFCLVIQSNHKLASTDMCKT